MKESEHTRQYDAFISYKHGEIDSFAAEKTQQLLEHFHIPKHLASQWGIQPIETVFVDNGELSSSADFSDEIRIALEHSKWLIVICSPDTPHSPYVALEIQTFLQYHDRSHILTILTSGEPAESFPAPLKEGTDIGHDEMLAADARGTTRREVWRKLKKDAIYRIAAPMLGIPYAVLRDRKKAYFRRRMTVAATLVMAVITAFSVYALQQTRSLSNQYRQTVLSQSQYLAKEAMDLLNEGDPMGAIQKALQALPADTDDRALINPDAVYALTQSVGAYKTPASVSGTLSPTKTFHGLEEIHGDLIVTEDGTRLFAQDGKQVAVIDTETMEQCHALETEENIASFAFTKTYLLEEKKQLLVPTNEGLQCWEYETGEQIWRAAAQGDVQAVAVSSDQKLAAVLTEEELDIIQVADGQIKQKKTLNNVPEMEICEPGTEVVFSPDGKTVAFSAHAATKEEKQEQEDESFDLDEWHDWERHEGIVFYHIAEDSLRYSELDKGNITYLCWGEDDSVYAASKHGSSCFFFNNNQVRKTYENCKAYLTKLKPDGGTDVWSQEFVYSLTNAKPRIYETKWNEQDAVMYGFSNYCVFLDKKTGTVLRQCELTDTIRAYAMGDQYMYAVCQDGTQTYIPYDKRTRVNVTYFFDNLKSICSNSGNFYVTNGEENTSSEYPTSIIRYQYEVSDANWCILQEDIGSEELLSVNVQDSLAENNCFAVLYTGLNQTKLLFVDGDTSRSMDISEERGDYELWHITEDKQILLYSNDMYGDDSMKPGILHVSGETGSITTEEIPFEPNEDKGFLSIDSICWQNDRVYYITDGFQSQMIYSWIPGSSKAVKIVEHQWDEKDLDYLSEKLVASPNGRQFAVLRYSWKNGKKLKNDIALYNAAGEIASFTLNDDLLYAMSLDWQNGPIFSQDGKWLVFPDTDSIKVVSAKNGSVQQEILFPEGEICTGIMTTEDSRNLLMVTDAGTVMETELRTGKECGRVTLSDAYTGGVHWYPVDEETILIAKDTFGWGELICTAPERFGVLAHLTDCLGYDASQDRLYILQKDLDENAVLGYFPHYSVSDLMEMGRERIGDSGEANDR